MRIYPSREEYLKKTQEYNQVPVYTELKGDLHTTISLFLKIRKERYQFLLESAVSGKYMGRYSFMGNSNHSIISKNNNVKEYNNGKFIDHGDYINPLDKVRDFFKTVESYTDDNLPPFSNGVVGYMGYDTIRYFEKLNAHEIDELEIMDFEFIITERVIIYDNLTHKLFIVSSPILTDGDVPEKAYDKAVASIKELSEELAKPTPEMASFSVRKEKGKVAFKSNFTKEEFENAVEKTKEHIYKGDIFQCVISQRLRIPIEGDAFAIYRSLRVINPSPYMFYLKCNDIEIIGSSPEVHVQLHEGQISVRPIAGTRPRGKTPEEDRLLEKELLADHKELAEHLMLVDLARNDVGRVSLGGSVSVDDFNIIEQYSHVMHIVSHVSGRLSSDFDLFDVLEATFPAGTVSGAPKIRAMEIISDMEKERRGIYAGMIGHFSFNNELDSCIAIRTIVVKNGVAYLQAGAGIVADSVPEKEYYESIHKLKAVARAIELAGEENDSINR